MRTSKILIKTLSPETAQLLNWLGQAHILPGFSKLRVEGITARHIGFRAWAEATEAELGAIKAEIEAEAGRVLA